MKPCRVVFLAAIAVGLLLVSHSVNAADDQPGPGSAPSNTNAPRILLPAIREGTPITPETNEPPPRLSETELKAQFRLLSELAREQRQRAEAATKNNQEQRAKWETDLAAEFGKMGSNILTQIEQVAAQKPLVEPPPPKEPLPIVNPAAESAALLSPPEMDYLAKLQDRIQAVQQQIDSATEALTAYAIQYASNSDNVVYGDNSESLYMQAVSRDLQRLQNEQAGLELMKDQYWALRSLINKVPMLLQLATNGNPIKPSASPAAADE